MLIHICDAIERYGPACLFATENFEGYNGNTRNSSIHSNHLSPSKDIANSFNNHRLIRSVAAASLLYDRVLHSYIQAGSKVIELFKTNVLFQKALGYNSKWNEPEKYKTGRIHPSQPSEPELYIPKGICEAYPSKTWKVLASFTLKNDQSFREGDFLSVRSAHLLTRYTSDKMIARVERIWIAGGCAAEETSLSYMGCAKLKKWQQQSG